MGVKVSVGVAVGSGVSVAVGVGDRRWRLGWGRLRRVGVSWERLVSRRNNHGGWLDLCPGKPLAHGEHKNRKQG